MCEVARAASLYGVWVARQAREIRLQDMHISDLVASGIVLFVNGNREGSANFRGRDPMSRSPLRRDAARTCRPVCSASEDKTSLGSEL